MQNCVVSLMCIWKLLRKMAKRLGWLPSGCICPSLTVNQVQMFMRQQRHVTKLTFCLDRLKQWSSTRQKCEKDLVSNIKSALFFSGRLIQRCRGCHKIGMDRKMDLTFIAA